MIDALATLWTRCFGGRRGRDRDFDELLREAVGRQTTVFSVGAVA